EKNMTNQSAQDLESKIVARALKDESFKQQILSDSKFAKEEYEKELGQKLPAQLQVKVLQEDANTAYVVLPYISPDENLTEEQLEAVASGFVISLPCTFGSATITDGVNIS
ncbi:MAG: NHLP leader peptide family RiPP precursor, partial [Cyanobacteria bacterium P01_A01_bin.83]